MNRPIRLVVHAALAMLLSGCAGFVFYTDSKLSAGNEIGIPLYPPKPYLLVANTGAKDKPTEISVIYIPDLARPIYAVPKGGFGSANLTRQGITRNAEFARSFSFEINKQELALPLFQSAREFLAEIARRWPSNELT